MIKFGKTLAKLNPGSPFYQNLSALYQSELPAKQMEAAAKIIADTSHFRKETQDRLLKDQTMKYYNARIRELQNDLKNWTSAKEKDELNFLKIESVLKCLKAVRFDKNYIVLPFWLR